MLLYIALIESALSHTSQTAAKERTGIHFRILTQSTTKKTNGEPYYFLSRSRKQVRKILGNTSTEFATLDFFCSFQRALSIKKKQGCNFLVLLFNNTACLQLPCLTQLNTDAPRQTPDSERRDLRMSRNWENGRVIRYNLTLAVLSLQTSHLFLGCGGTQALRWANLPWSH